MTGRRAGICTGNEVGGYANPGFGFRGGGRRGWRNVFRATGLFGWQRSGFSPLRETDESTSLKAEADLLKRELDAINRRLDEIEKK